MIDIRDLRKAFGEKEVLRGIDLKVETGESMVIIGGSGTGKSVLLKCILGLVHPDSGTILLDGEDVEAAERDAFLARFGMLFQGAALFDSLTVWQNVAFRLLRGSLKRPRGGAGDRRRETAARGARARGRGPLPRGAFWWNAEARGPGARHRGGPRDHLL
jgi:phospholipid/cholesterol/gamma-HCH transport system ATP-binding protein